MRRGLTSNGRCVALSVIAAMGLASPGIAAVPRPAERPPTIALPASHTPNLPLEEIRRINERIAQSRAGEAGQNPAASQGAGDLQSRAIEAAAAVQAKEAALSLAEDNLDILATQETKIRARLAAERKQLIEMLSALQRLEREQPPAIAVAPEDATSAVRSAILLSEVVPRLRRKADSLARELDDLRRVRERITQESAALSEAAQALRAEQAELEALIAERGRRRPAAISFADNTELAELSRRAQDLTALVEGLGNAAATVRPILKPSIEDGITGATAPRRGEGEQEVAGLWTAPGVRSQSFDGAIGKLRMPAVGKIVEKFGVPNESGGTTKGIKIGVRPAAQVVSPYDGRVKYAGPLKVYGQVLIVETSDDYLIILAGLSRIDASVGQWLLAGEPIGRMAAEGEEGPGALYVEFRRGRNPIDPLPWLSTSSKEG